MNKKYNEIIFLYIEIMKILNNYNTFSKKDKIKILNNFSINEQKLIIDYLKIFKQTLKEYNGDE